MPRVNICNPSALGKGQAQNTRRTIYQARLELERSIVDQFGMCLDLTKVGQVLGLRDRGAVRAWIQEEKLEAVVINRRKNYLAKDIARALELSKFRADCAE